MLRIRRKRYLPMKRSTFHRISMLLFFCCAVSVFMKEPPFR